MRRLTGSYLLTIILCATAALTISPAVGWAQDNNTSPSAQTGYEGDGYISFVDPDRSRIGFTDLHGVNYTIDTSSAKIVVPALGTDHAATGDLVKNMRIAINGYMLSPTIIEASEVRVLPYVPPTNLPAPSADISAASPHIDLEGTIADYHPMEQTGLNYDLYTVHINDHDRNIRVGGPDVVRSSSGDSLDGPLNPGDRVHVTGTLLPSGDVQADRVVRVGSGDFYPGQKHFEGGNTLHGYITDQASFYSRDITVRVRDTDVTIKVPGGIQVREDGHPASIHDLGSHEHVTVYGYWLDVSDFQADRIEANSGDDQ
jgi:hypothetical protein